jgi:hypothetical protein
MMTARRLELAKRKARTSLTAINNKVEARLKASALKGKDDAAFRLFVRKALNGDTDHVTGWTKEPAES